MVEASVKFFIILGFEPSMQAQICSVLTTTPLRVTKKGIAIFLLFLPDCL